MTKKIFYIDDTRCCSQSVSKARLGDLFYVVDSPLIDVLLNFNVPSQSILTPLSSFTQHGLNPSLFGYYANLEESLKDQNTYINWLLCNQALLIKYLICVLETKYSNESYNITTYKPLFYLNRRMNSGLPISIYYYLRDYACTHFVKNTNCFHSTAHFCLPIKYILNSILKHCIPALLSCSLNYKNLGYQKNRKSTIVTGTGVPQIKLEQIKHEHASVFQLKPASEFRYGDFLQNTIFFRDFISVQELISWRFLVQQLIYVMFQPESKSPETDTSINLSNNYELSANIHSIILRLSMSYPSVLHLSSNVYLSDHINLFTFAFLTACTVEPVAYQLIAHGGDRRSPICLQLITNKVLSSDYYPQTCTVLSKASTDSFLLTHKTPLIVVSYSSFKRIGFKNKPEHLCNFNNFILQLKHSSCQNALNWDLYVAKKPRSESLLSNIDLVPALQNIPIISTKCIPSKFPTATIIAVGQLGTAHVQLANAGHRILYFGDDPNQSTITMSHYKYRFHSDGTLLLDTHTLSEDKARQPNHFYISK